MATVHYGNFITFNGSQETANKLMTERCKAIQGEKKKTQAKKAVLKASQPAAKKPTA